MIKTTQKPNRKYRNALILKPGFRFHSLKTHCQSLVFVTDGITVDLTEISSLISAALVNFDPSQDCIVPVGTTVSNLLMGYMVAKTFPDSSITLAIYRSSGKGGTVDDYVFVDLPASVMESSLF